MKHQILKWLSKFLPIKIPAGTNLSVTTVDNKPFSNAVFKPVEENPVLVMALTVGDKQLDGRPLFFVPKPKVGPFEYKGTIKGSDLHVIEDLSTGQLFKISTDVLKHFFKAMMVKYVPPVPPSKNETEQ